MSKYKTDALQLAARFSYSPNHLGYCGLNTAGQVFRQCLSQGTCEPIPEEISHFNGLNPYMYTIAEVTQRPLFDYEVVEAFWLGNDLLKQFKVKDYAVLIEHYKKQGIPDFFTDELAQRPPKAFIPCHLFSVLHIGVGRASGSVPFTLNSINQCMIRWGQVKAMKKEVSDLSKDFQGGYEIECEVQSLEYQAKVFKPVIKTITAVVDPLWVPQLAVGDWIGVHWGFVSKKLSSGEVNNLEYWLPRVLEAVDTLLE